ncbi:MAG: hypothetical protein ACOZJZ_00300 [Pseudomonadota bacterium]
MTKLEDKLTSSLRRAKTASTAGRAASTKPASTKSASAKPATATPAITPATEPAPTPAVRAPAPRGFDLPGRVWPD